MGGLQRAWTQGSSDWLGQLFPSCNSDIYAETGRFRGATRQRGKQTQDSPTAWKTKRTVTNTRHCRKLWLRPLSAFSHFLSRSCVCPEAPQKEMIQPGLGQAQFAAPFDRLHGCQSTGMQREAAPPPNAGISPFWANGSGAEPEANDSQCDSPALAFLDITHKN